MIVRSSRAALLASPFLSLCPEAYGQEIAVTPLVDARLRWERVEQDGLPKTADAVTLRVRSGVQARRGPWSALVESEATIGIVPRYNDGVNARAGYPTIGDPQNIELNRATLRYEKPSLSVTVGRQVLEFADQRFVGASAFRQNQQSHDAVHVTATPLPRLAIEAAYSWSDRTINGINGRDARQQAISGNNWFGTIGYATPVGTVSGFGYLVDQDEAAVQNFRLSSQTYGARLQGSRPIGGGWNLGYAGSFARQSNYHRNPNRYAASYYLGEATLSHKLLNIGGGYEVLGADKGVALTSVQTPLSSLFRFQGWADKFTTTPPDGIRDLYATAGLGWAQVGQVRDVALSAAYHTFDSDRLGRHYGSEVDLLASGKIHGVTASVRYAHYKAKTFATDTDKLWLTLEWSIR